MTVKVGHEEYLELAAIYALGALDGRRAPAVREASRLGL